MAKPRHRVRALLAAGAMALVGVPVALQPSGIQADTVSITRPDAPLTPSADALPTPQVNGIVRDLVIANGKVYAAGDFTQARPAGAPAGVNQTPRLNLLAFDLATGQLDTQWTPSLNGSGRSIAASADGSVIYVAGYFTTVNGVTRNRIAAIDAHTGNVISPWSASLNGSAMAVDVRGNTVYVGGRFTAANGQPRSRLAAFNATNGALLSWAPSVDPVSGVTDTRVEAITVNERTGDVFVGGNFERVNNTTQRGTARIHGQSGALLPWGVNQVVLNSGNYGLISALDNDGEKVYGVGTVFFGSGSSGVSNFEGTFAANADTGELVWINGCRGDQHDVAVVGDIVYGVTHQHECAMIGAQPDEEPDRYQYVTATDARGTPGLVNGWGVDFMWVFDGMPASDQLHWAPDFTAGQYTGLYQAAWSVAGNEDYVVFGGEFLAVNGQPQQGLVRFARVDLAPNAQGPTGTAGFAPTVTPLGPGTVRVGFVSPYDRDNERLQYEVRRRSAGANVNTEVVVATLQADVAWYSRPRLGFVDETAVPGQSYQYRIRAIDPFGNSLTSASSAAVTIPAGQEPDRAYFDQVRSLHPVNLWRLGEASGNTAYDWIGSNDLTLSGSLTRNQPGALQSDPDGALGFNQVGNTAPRATTTFRQEGPHEFTIEAWFNTTSTGGGALVSFGANNLNGTDPLARSNSNYSDRHLYMSANGQVRFGVRPTIGSQGQRVTINSSASYNDGQWHHAVATLSKNGMFLFVDGQQVASNTSVTGAQTYWGYWRVGGDNVSGYSQAPNQTNEGFEGRLDEVAIYDRALTVAEIQQNYLANSTAQFSPTISADPASVVITAGDTMTVDLTLVDANGDTVDVVVVTPPSPSWATTAGALGDEDLVLAPPVGSESGVPYTVRLRATDGTGTPDAILDIPVTVVAPPVDETPPVITVLGANPLEITVGATYSDPGATAVDDVDGDLTDQIDVDADDVDTGTVGTYTVTYSVSDAAGNAAQATRTVIVVAEPVDETPPVITVLGANPLEITVGATYSDPGATAVDDVDGDLTDQIDVDADDVDTGTVGTYTVTYSVSDAAGNAAQATRTVIVSDVPDPDPQPVDVVTAGSVWSYYYDSAAPPGAWRLPGFDASGWATGAAPLGWGHANLGTTLTFDGTRPLTSYYRRTFNVQDVSAVESLTLTTRADDGIVVYVNGVEVGRSNMPAGAVGHNTYATAAPNATVALANPVTFTVSGALLQTGENVITAEVHSNYRTTPSHSFELTATLNFHAAP